MNREIPRTPFSTRLSGSARETEIRLRNLFSGPKKRPPALFLALMFSMCLLCGNLVSCQNAGVEAELPPPDLSVVPVNLDSLPIPEPIYTLEKNGNVRIEGLGNAIIEWSPPSPPRRSSLYFARDPAFCCPSLAGRTAEGSAVWQDDGQEIVSADITVNDSRLEGRTIDGYSLHFVVDWAKEKVIESSFTSEAGDGTLELSEEEMLYAGWVLWKLMKEAEWRTAVDVTVFDAAPDLDRNGVPEMPRLVTLDEGMGQRFELWEDSKLIWSEEGYFVHTGYNALFLCVLNGEAYLLRYNPTMYTGTGTYNYQLFSLENGTETVVQENSVTFDTNFYKGKPLYGEFDPEAIAAFMDEVNDLLSYSTQLLNTNEGLLDTFAGKTVAPQDTLGWLDLFDRDQSKSLLENLRDFRDIMSRVMTEGGAG